MVQTKAGRVGGGEIKPATGTAALPTGYREGASAGAGFAHTAGLPEGYRRVINTKTGNVEVLAADGKLYLETAGGLKPKAGGNLAGLVDAEKRIEASAGAGAVPNLTERGTLVNLRPKDVAIAQRPVRTLVQDESGRYWLQTESGKRLTPSGTYDFVTMPDGSVRVTRPNVNQDFSTHLGLSGGGEVKYAGSIRFGNNDGPVRGTITHWTNNSGHYQPPATMSGNSGLPQDLFKPR